MKNNRGSVGVFFSIILFVILLGVGVYYIYFNSLDKSIKTPILSGEIIDNNEETFSGSEPIWIDSAEHIVQNDDEEKSGDEALISSGDEQTNSGEISNLDEVTPNEENIQYITLNNSNIRSLLRSISVNDELLEVVIKKSPNKIFEYDFGTLKLDDENYNLYFSIIYNQANDKFTSTAYIKSNAGVRVVLYEANSLAIDTPLLTTFMDKYISKYTVIDSTKVYIEICSRKSVSPIYSFDIELGAKPLRMEYTDTGIKYCSYDTPHTVMGINSTVLKKLAATFYEVVEVDGEFVKNVVLVDTNDYINAK